jgi:hopene-associated glycosyltransferase HpnB
LILIVALGCTAAWVYLLAWHGGFWRARPVLPATRPSRFPAIAAIVPAREEAASIGACVASLVAQDYAGPLAVIVVDDGSTDGTSDVARSAGAIRADRPVQVIRAPPRPAGWSGKVAAMARGVDAAPTEATFYLFTDADIAHAPDHVAALVAKAIAEDLDMVSGMVQLRCDSLAERLLIPVFVYFFQMLYPFSYVNEPQYPTAAAAGGSMLVRVDALNRIGGLVAIRDALIDDVALARRIKSGGKIWLGHSTLARSCRAYPGFVDIWRMIARSAYAQLNYSPVLLVLTVLGMTFVFLAPVGLLFIGEAVPTTLGAACLIGSCASLAPAVRLFDRHPVWAAGLPVAALFYTAATIGSAVNHYTRRGVTWKGRSYRRATS